MRTFNIAARYFKHGGSLALRRIGKHQRPARLVRARFHRVFIDAYQPRKREFRKPAQRSPNFHIAVRHRLGMYLRRAYVLRGVGIRRHKNARVRAAAAGRNFKIALLPAWSLSAERDGIHHRRAFRQAKILALVRY